MSEHRLSDEARETARAIFKKRARRHMPTAYRFRPMPGHRRLSTRGEPGQTWRTKRWTPARLAARDEFLYG